MGLNLPARLLVTAVHEGRDSGLPPHQLLSLGAALLAALSTDPDLVSRPQLLATVPLLLGVLADGPAVKQQNRAEPSPDCEVRSGDVSDREVRSGDVPDREVRSGDVPDSSGSQETSSTPDEAMAADCYQVLTAVCALPRGPDQLLGRGAVPALCRAVQQNRTLSQQRGLALLGGLLTGHTRHKAWSKHPTELLSLLLRLSRDFCRAPDVTRLGLCVQLVRFLPPPGAALQSQELEAAVSGLWAALRPLLQAKLTPAQIGPVLVLGACLLDLNGWKPVGPPRFCCLLVNRACVEVRMGLEEPPGTDVSPELQQTLTGKPFIITIIII